MGYRFLGLIFFVFGWLCFKFDVLNILSEIRDHAHLIKVSKNPILAYAAPFLLITGSAFLLFGKGFLTMTYDEAEDRPSTFGGIFFLAMLGCGVLLKMWVNHKLTSAGYS